MCELAMKDEEVKRRVMEEKMKQAEEDFNTANADADTALLKSIIDIRYLPFSSRNHDVAFTKVADDTE